MTDISLSVGLETRNAKEEALALAKSLNQIEEAGKRLEKMRNPVKGLAQGLSEANTAAKQQTTEVDSLVSKYDKFTRTSNTLEKQLEALRADQKSLNDALLSGGKSTGAFRRALAEVESQIAKNKSAMKAARLEINAGAQAAIKASNDRKAKAEELGKLQEKWDSLRRKALDDITKKDQRSAIARAKAEQDEVNKKLEMTEKWRKLRLKAIDDITKKDAMAAKARAGTSTPTPVKLSRETQTMMAGGADKQKIAAIRAELAAVSKAQQQGQMTAMEYARAVSGLTSQLTKAQLASRGMATNTNTTAKSMSNASMAANSYSKSLGRTSKAAYRAASANRENNAILSDQVGFWRFAGRGAALYFSSLATDRLLAVNLEMQSLQQALNVIGGSQEAGAESMEFISDTAERLGIEIQSLGSGYKLLAAATRGTTLEGKLTEDIFSSVAEAATAMKLSVADTDGVMRALSQIMSKGKVSSEELRQQLGDRLPGAFQAAARAMNVTTAELNKMLENGEVISEDFLPKFAKELRNTFEASPDQLEGPDRAINRMKNSFVDLAVILGESGLNEAIVKISNSLAAFAKSDEAKDLMEGIGAAAVWVADNIDLLADSAQIMLVMFAGNTLGNTLMDLKGLGGGFLSAGNEALTFGGIISKLGAIATVAFGAFQFGSYLSDQFEIARLAGSYFTEFVLDSWTALIGGTKIAWNLIELSVKTVFLGLPALAFEAVNATIDGFEKLAKYLDDTFGTELSSKINFEDFKINNEPLKQIQTELIETEEAWKGMIAGMDSNNEIFEQQRKDIEALSKAAEANNMSLAEYEDSLEKAAKAAKKKAKADAKAAKDALESAKAQEKYNKAMKDKAIVKALKDFDELSAKYSKNSKAAQEQAEAIEELYKIYNTGAIDDTEFLSTLSLIEKAFQSQLNPVKDITDEMELLKLAYSKFNDEVEREAFIKAFDKFPDKAEQIAKVTKEAKELQKALEFKDNSNLFKNLTKGLDSISDSLGGTIGEALLNDDWNAVGTEIGGMLSGALSNSLSGAISGGLTGMLGSAIAGPIGAIAGGVLDSVLNTFIADGFSGTLFGDVEDPTERRQRKLGTGTTLGDDKAQSESIVKSLNIISNTNQELVNINTGMLRSLSSFSDSINATISAIAGVDLGAGIQAPIANEDIGNALAGGITLGIPNMGSLATDFLDVFSFGLFSALGDLLGGKVRKLDEGVQILGGYLTDLTNNTVVEAFATFKEKKHAFDDYDQKERTSRLDQGVSDQFTSLFVQIADTVATGAETLGLSTQQVEDIFSNFEIDTTKISLEGLDVEGQAEALNTYFSSVFDELTLATIPWLEGLQKAGEGLGETLSRVSTNMQLGVEAVAVLGVQTATTFGDIIPEVLHNMAGFEKLVGKDLTAEYFAEVYTSLVELSGGAEEFSSSLVAFESNFLSASEQLENQERRLTAALEGVTDTLPDTRQGFADLVSSQKTWTEAGRENIATLLRLQGAADQYYDAIEAGTEPNERAAKLEQLRNGLKEAEIDLANSLLTEEERLVKARQDELAEIADIAGNSHMTNYLTGLALALHATEDAIKSNIESVKQMESIQSRTANAELELIRATAGEEAYLAEVRAREMESVRGLANEEGLIAALQELYDIEDAARGGSAALSNLNESLHDMVTAAVDAFYALDFQAFNLDGSNLTGDQINNISQALVEGVGGISEFNSAVSTFASNFFTEEAKFSKSSDAVAAAFAKYNAVIPDTRQGFTDLFQSLNAVTDAGAIADALKIAEDANVYYSYLEKQAESISNLQIRLFKAQGNDLAALNKTREKELENATASEKAILRQIYAAEDLATANEERIEREKELLDQMADVQDRLNDAYREQIDNIEDTASRMRGLNESLMDFGTDLALGDLSTLSPQEQLALARSEFESTASAAQSGDIDALERLQSVAQAFLEESREFQGSGGTFAQDFARVQEVISNSASVADLQADQAERQAMLMERQLERQQENNEDTKSIKEALIALIAVQKESGLLSLSELEAMKRSLAILESNSSLSSSQI